MKTIREWLRSSECGRMEYLIMKKLMNANRENFPDWFDTEITKEQYNQFLSEYIISPRGREVLREKVKVSPILKRRYRFGPKGKIKEPKEIREVGRY